MFIRKEVITIKITQIQGLAPALPRRKRVAAYARVSSGKEAMLHSLSAQISYYSDYIRNHSDWEYVQVFVDEALTGTKEARPQFQEMLEACRSGRVDLIITKSISRFARNTVTVLESVRELKNLGVDVFFEEQNIHSMSAEGEVMLTILASYAQEESLSASENQKWRVRKSFSEGKICGMRMFGFRIQNGQLVVKPDEAQIVKTIFSDYLSGMGIVGISKKLLAQGIKLNKSTISDMLRNEKYMGDLRLQKTFIKDHISKTKVKNVGQLPQYLVENSHDFIIGKEIFIEVQAEISRRSKNYNPKPRQSTPYPYTGLITCGKCGSPYKRKYNAAGTKYEKAVWICTTYDTKGKEYCDSQQIPEDILHEKVDEVGGIKQIGNIKVPDKNTLVFTMKDGRVLGIPWVHTSRSKSWTPQMKEAARQRQLARAQKRRENEQ
ncbi:recombinase family protein [Scatolibacter rhodanostii]|uniref:recombinase family protein n=1 Tax=Scatolibacter rhodanostii TaxID=2014781 RepID=UPI000C08D0C8|nr:recombinase family protein [Scatolibacter rhodanostii]